MPDQAGSNGTVADPSAPASDGSALVAGPTPVAGSALVEVVAGHFRTVEIALAELARRLDAEGERALARERVIDRQHAEIERLRSVERAGTMRPVIVDLCRLRNDLRRQAAMLPAEQTGARCAELLSSFADSVGEALERCGVVAMARQVGSPFVAGQQRVAEVIEVDDPGLDGMVAEVVQDGYVEVDGGKVVAPARIKLHRTVITGGAGADPSVAKENADD